VIPGGSSSVISGSVSQEVDVVDIYKKKIQNNIHLKQKNLKIIKLLFIFSLVCFIALSATLNFSFTNLGNFTFKNTYLTGIVSLQSTVSKLFGIAFIAHFNHLFVNNTMPGENSTMPGGNNTNRFALVNATSSFKIRMDRYFADVSTSIDTYLKLDPQTYLIQENAIKSFLYSWDQWNIDSEKTSSMTFFNYIKSLSVTLNFDTLFDKNKFRESTLYYNTEPMIQKIYNLEEDIRGEFDESYQYMSQFLFYFILAT
jgi:hypothetical protein